MVQRFLEAAILGAMRIAVAQMPFAKVPRGVSRIGEVVGHGRDVGAHHRAALANGGRAVSHRIHPGHQLAARGRAHGRHVKVGEPHAFGVQPVDVRRFDHWVAVGRKVAIALVIGQDQDHVGLRCTNRHRLSHHGTRRQERQ